MNLERHFSVLWRYRTIVVCGVVLACVLAFLAAYRVSFDGGLSLERRGSEEWSSTSQILVTQPGFPWGRVTLPGTATTPGSQPESSTSGSSRLQYADPGRFTNLAQLYSVISYSDQVRELLPQRPKIGQIQATLSDPTGRGDNFLPIINLVTKGKTPDEALTLNVGASAALNKVLVSQQRTNHIPRADRVLLSQLSKPSPPVLVAGRSKAAIVLAFLLCLIATVALAHILEAASQARRRRETATQIDAAYGSGIGDEADDAARLDDGPEAREPVPTGWPER